MKKKLNKTSKSLNHNKKLLIMIINTIWRIQMLENHWKILLKKS